MSDYFHTETMDIDGRTYRVHLAYDQYTGAPWTDCDGHGPVRESRERHGVCNESYPLTDKKPGEIPLNDPDRNEFQYFYDWQAAIKQAHKDGWGLCPENRAALVLSLGRDPTPGEIYAEAVRLDFNYCRGWLRQDWFYCGVIVECAGESESLWGVECGLPGEYWRDVAKELASEVSARLDARKATACDNLREARDVMADALRGLRALGNRAGYGVADALLFALKAAHKQGRDAVAELRVVRGEI